MSNSNFDQVREFHEVFEHPVHNTPQSNVFDEKPELVKLRIGLIQEELSEYVEACNNKDLVEATDALADMLYVIYGAGHALGVNLDDAFRRVHQSNMTKACNSEEQARETVEYIRETQPRYNPTYKKSNTGNYWIVYDQNTGKILKNKYYQAVDLSDFK